MKIDRVDLAHAGREIDTVIVIDVMRAFTTAAFAFEAGAERIILVAGVEEAFALRNRFPKALLMGEQGGYTIEGFDFGNSPNELAGRELTGSTLLQRTSAGTQGAAASRGAENIYATGLCNARATALAVLKDYPESLTLVETGVHEGGWGEEDVACADYIQSLLAGAPLDQSKILERVRNTRTAQLFSKDEDPRLPKEDLEMALAIDRFDWVMKVDKMDGLLVMTRCMV